MVKVGLGALAKAKGGGRATSYDLVLPAAGSSFPLQSPVA